ncbi:hypothetical protein QUF63_16980 [Anaerolineales bacterium HSG25]|nr:hypothetical protein [Anaerolineales bacterium HSG25]
MGTIPVKELLKKWKQDDLTVEMAIGHILQHLVLLEQVDADATCNCRKLSTAIDTINLSRATLRDDVDRLLRHNDLKSSQDQPPRRKRGRPRKPRPNDHPL